MNPQWHDEFVALCALFPTGELTEEEWALLQVHLAYCESCQALLEEHQQLHAETGPVLACIHADLADAPVDPRYSMEAAEARLFEQLDARTARSSPTSQTKKWLSLLPIAAGLTVAGTLIAWQLHLRQARDIHVAVAQPQPVVAPVRSVAPVPPTVSSKPSADTRESAVLRSRLHAVEAQQERAEAAAKVLEQQRAQDALDLDSARAQAAELQSQIATLKTSLDQAQSQSVTVAQQSKQIVLLQAQLQQIDAENKDKERLLALDKQLLTHDRDIRDVIAARDLYIADIYDVEDNGKTAKPFGRVFYTKGRSLVFYGYDLDKKPGLKQTVAFQAWGTSDDQRSVNLGLFYQDKSDKRWVLQFNDPKMLAHLNKVFVTAEPEGGSSQPTGKPLLMAYLQVRPNHP